VSFPKSGRTWLRVLLGAAEAVRTGAALRRTSADWLRRDAPELAGKPVLFTHALAELPGEPLAHVDLVLRYVAERTRVFLVRDPRDTVVSYYFQQIKRRRNDHGDVPAQLADFVRHPFYGVDRINGVLNAMQAAFERGPGAGLLVSYEALHADTPGTLAHVLRFLGAPPLEPAALGAAVDFGRFENMRAMESSGSLSGRLRPTDRKDAESYKTRKGTVGGFTSYLVDDDVEWMEERIRKTLVPAIGYATPGAAPATCERAAELGPSARLRDRHAELSSPVGELARE